MKKTIMNINAEPLFFTTIYKEKIWGGLSLATAFNKKLPLGKFIGEAWEICGFGLDQSTVCQGASSGKTLGELFTLSRKDLVNDYPCSTFPLLLKFIDAADNLSVQIHPDQKFAVDNGMGEYGKTECWYILDAAKNAQLIIGFKERVSSDDIRYAIKNDTLYQLLNYVNVKAGEVYYIPAGTVHAILGGSLIYEIQEPSDTTFRLYDWGRKDATGKYRNLHVEESIQIADLIPHNYRVDPLTVNCGNYSHSFRVACRYFALEDYLFNCASNLRLPPKEFVQILTALNGNITISYPNGEAVLKKGQTVLLPSILQNVEISGDALSRFLCASVPDLQKDIINPLINYDMSPLLIKELGGFEEKNDLLSLLPC